MDVKEAVQQARQYAQSVFEGETVRLEEIWYDDDRKEWCVTIGLQRSEPASGFDMVAAKRPSTRMHYKIVRIDDETRAIKSVRNHDKMPVSPL